MANESIPTAVYSFIVSVGSVVIVGLSGLSIRTVFKNFDNQHKQLEKEIADLKNDLIVQKAEFNKVIEDQKKDLGEAFARIRDLERLTDVIKVEFDNLKADHLNNHKRSS